jgi:hypothetical protein
MSLIVNPSATVNWTYTREQLAYRSLQKMGRLGAGDTPPAEDMQLVVDTIDSILKNLAVHGYKYPKTAAATYAATFAIGVQTATLPADFYNLVSMNQLDSSGNERFIFPATTHEWNDIVNKTSTGGDTLRAYIDNFNVLHIWPKPSVATTINVYYQQVILDSTAGAAIDLDSPWMLALPYGVGSELGEEFELSDAKIKRLTARWIYERDMLIQHEGQNQVNQVSVDD